MLLARQNACRELAYVYIYIYTNGVWCMGLGVCVSLARRLAQRRVRGRAESQHAEQHLFSVEGPHVPVALGLVINSTNIVWGMAYIMGVGEGSNIAQ